MFMTESVIGDRRSAMGFQDFAFEPIQLFINMSVT